MTVAKSSTGSTRCGRTEQANNTSRAGLFTQSGVFAFSQGMALGVRGGTLPGRDSFTAATL